MNQQRLHELMDIAENEIRYRGQMNGWKTIQENYERLWHLTEKEAQIVAYLVQNATVALPTVPLHLMLED